MSRYLSEWGNSSQCFALVAGLTVLCGTASVSNRSPVLGSIAGMGLSARVYADGTYSMPAELGPGSTLTITHTGLAGRPAG